MSRKIAFIDFCPYKKWAGIRVYHSFHIPSKMHEILPLVMATNLSNCSGPGIQIRTDNMHRLAFYNFALVA